jgi:ABC-type Zn uptake system ZnuABC Zn-binding protein ZnuA
MRKPAALLIGWLFHMLAGNAWPAPLEVVTTTTELRSLVEVIGGESVRATSLVPGDRDAEEYVARPQDLLLIRRAHLVVRVGLDYDLWLDALLSNSGNPALRKGGQAYVDASQGVMLLDVRPGGLGGTGHSHGAGNPHYWLDPQNAELITAHILLALADLSPAEAGRFEARRTSFLARLAKRQSDWQRRLRPLAGQALIAYHNSWPYLARRFHINFVGTIEPRPGVAAPPAHLAQLLRTMREQRVAGIVVGTREPRKDAEFLSAKTGAPIVTLAESVGAKPTIHSYEDLIDFNVTALENLMAKGKRQ